MGSKYSNPGRVDIDRATDSIVGSNGGVNSYWDGDHIHTSVYSRENTGGAHLSYDEYPDGSIRNVHTDRGGSGYMTYGNK